MSYTPRAAAEFEEHYARRSSDVTVAELHRWGRFAETCDCGEPNCEGWRMGHQWEDAIEEDRMRSLIEASSLGTPGARALRARAPADAADRVRAHPLYSDEPRPLTEDEQRRWREARS